MLIANISVASTTGNYIVQPLSPTQFNIKNLNNSFTGINSGASGGSAPGGGFLMYITWTFPDNTISAS